MKNFIKGIFTNGDPISSKRVFGAIGFISYIVLSYFDKPDLNLLAAACMLLGLDSLINIFKKP